MIRQALLLVVVTLLVGCGASGSNPSAGKGGDGQTLRIAVIPKGTTHDFWKSVHAGAQQAAAELGGVEIIWNGPDDEKDKGTQIRIVDNFVAQRVDGICLAPIDRDALVAVVKRAKKRNIPTVVFDSALSDLTDIVSYVATDNHHGGVVAGERLAKVLGGKGGVILLRYQAGSESTEQREQGFLDVMKKYPGIKILSESQRVDSNTQKALSVSEGLLYDNRDAVRGVFTVCEPNNKGMLQALKNRKMLGKVKFVGFDPDPLSVEALRKKQMDGIVLQNPVRMGYLAVKAMVAHLRGEKVDKRTPTGEVLATPDNLDDPKIHALLFPKQVE